MLVRGLRRLPGEKREDFRGKVKRLREHFEQFNADASEICQWLMSFRPGGKKGSDATKIFWDFILEPDAILEIKEKGDSDRIRRKLFDLVAAMAKEPDLDNSLFSLELLDSARAVAVLPLTPTAKRLFGRLAQLNPAHRQVLLKAAAEWVLARYQRIKENREKQFGLWKLEKEEWETQHPELTPKIREQFNAIFKNILTKEKGQKPSKNPRICRWEILKDLKDNCQYAGSRFGGKNHGPLCAKFNDFCRAKKWRRFNKKHFINDANVYLEMRKNNQNDPKIIEKFLKENPQAENFPQAWEDYLKALGINEDKALQHCQNFGDDQECEYNPHTEDCRKYGAELANRPDLQPWDQLYREWRKEYLAGPSKPSFRYPSSRHLPMPKIFGKDFFRPDFEKSVIELRLDDMPEGCFERFAFKPWPKDYDPQPDPTKISSAHAHFVGTRARVGFRFSVPQAKSRFGVSQDEIDELRSRKFPRRKQDQEFLEAARQRLLETFSGQPEKELKILAVDLGSREAGAAVFQGKKFIQAEPLKIIKIDRLYSETPKVEDGRKRKERFDKKKGLGKEHVVMHLESWAKEASEITQKRATDRGKDQGVLGIHDLRKLGLHTQWMIRDWVRLNAAQIIEASQKHQADLIVFESLRGFRARGYEVLDPDQKRRLAFFAYGKIRRKVAEKAVERGMRIVTVPYFESSQHCGKCGKKQEDTTRCKDNKLKRRRFECEYCQNKDNSDANAARVLARVFWGEIQLPVDQKKLDKKIVSE